MEIIELFNSFSHQALSIALATIRIAVAFLLLPIFSSELIPPLIRNAIFVALALIITILQPTLDPNTFTTLMWLKIIGKEIFLGIAIGIFFGLFLWAFEAAGQIIDAQIGMNAAQVMDPLSGQQTTLIGEFMGRFINYLFMVAGGLMYLVALIMESYVLWPLGSLLPKLNKVGLSLFEFGFSEFFAIIFILASPLLLVFLLIDICMGLINRDAQQFNVSFLSMPIKMLAAVFILILSLISLSNLLADEIRTHFYDTISLIKKLIN